MMVSQLIKNNIETIHTINSNIPILLNAFALDGCVVIGDPLLVVDDGLDDVDDGLDEVEDGFFCSR